MQIAKVLSTWTPAQIKKMLNVSSNECFFKQNLKTNSAAMKQYQESLSLEKNQILCNNADAHKKQRESLPPEKKVKILETDADAHKKTRVSFSWRQRPICKE